MVLSPLAVSEQQGMKLGASLGAETLAALCAKATEEILKAALEYQPWFAPSLDGYFLPQDAWTVFAAGRQSHVPLLAGWNADEVRQSVTPRKEKPSAQSLVDQNHKRFGEDAEAILEACPARTDAEALESAAAHLTAVIVWVRVWSRLEAETARSPLTGRHHAI